MGVLLERSKSLRFIAILGLLLILGCVIPESRNPPPLEAPPTAEEPVCLAADLTPKHGQPAFDDVLECLGRTTPDGWPRLLDLGRKVSAGDPLRIAFLDHYEAQLAVRRGEYRRALELSSKASAIFEAQGEMQWLAASFHNLGVLYSALGRGQEALAEFEKALVLYRNFDNREREAAVLTQMGWVFFLKRDEPRATDLLEHALVLRTSPRGRATTLDRLGSVHRDAGRQTEALRCYREALEILETLDEPARGHVLANLGWLHLADGALDTAGATMRASLPLIRHLGDRDAEAHLLVGLARIARRRGQPREALQYLEEGIRIVEGLRRATPLRTLRSTYLALRQDYYFDHVELLLELDRLEPGRGHDQRAVLASERGRARALLDVLARRLGPAAAGENGHRSELDRLGRNVTELQIGILAQERRRQKITESESKALSEALSSYARLLEIQDGVSSAAGNTPPIVGAVTVREFLDRETTILNFVLGEEYSYLFLIDHLGLSTYVLPRRSTIERVALDLYSALAGGPDLLSRDQIPQMARELGKAVLAPVAERLRRRVVVIKDGALHWIPFGVLRSPLSPDRILLQDRIVTVVPSLSSLAQLRHRSGGFPPSPRVAVFAPDAGPSPRTGDGPFPRLRSVAAEVNAIQAHSSPERAVQILGTDATPERLARISRDSVDVLHLAAHAFVFRSHPELSAIVLTDGRGGDQLLRLHDVFRLEIPMELVVLSACETALGDLLRGEGMVSMAHAFLAAGAARTLVSLWRIDDVRTSRLMSELYRAMIQEQLAPASALRQAQLGLIDDHPYYWAAFELHGGG